MDMFITFIQEQRSCLTKVFTNTCAYTVYIAVEVFVFSIIHILWVIFNDNT